MSLVFTEGFDHLLTPAQLVTFGKWTTANGGNITVGRNGGYCWYGTSSTSNLSKLIPAADAHATLICGFAFYFTNTSSTMEIMSLYGDGGTTQHVALYFDRATNLFKVYRGAPTTNLLGTQSTTGLAINTWYYVELKATLSDTVGTIDLKIDGASVLSLTNQDTKNAGTATVFNYLRFNAYPVNLTMLFDDIYVCNAAGSLNNDFLGDVRIECLTPNADGNYTAWTARNLNRLPNANVSGIETDASGWTALTNCSVSRVTTPVNAGSGALQLSSTAAGTIEAITATGLSGVPVVPGTTYTAKTFARNAASIRTPYTAIRWYDNTGAVISTQQGANGSGSTSNFINGSEANFTAPINAAYAAIIAGFAATGGAAELHYIDSVSFTETSTSQAYADGGVTTHHTTVTDYTLAAGTQPDASYVVSQVDNDIDTWAHTNPLSSNAQAVKAAMQYAMARTDTMSAKSLALVARLSGTDVASANTPMTQAYSVIQKAWELDPAGAAWTVANLAAAEFGVKVRP